jgi:hypothetical protein
MTKVISSEMKAKGREIWQRWLNAKVKAAKLRIQVDKIGEKILSEGNFLDEKGERVLKHSKSWKIENKEGFETFYSRLENACNDAGLRVGLEAGYCPALIAENDVIKIEWEILNWTGEAIGDPKFAENVSIYMDKRKQALELFDRLHVK